ncbi:MAG: hypothetical protein ABEI96_01550 [Haloarculaceae archaeon]
MTEEIDLREKDLAVLQAIENGATTTHELNEVTTLTTREINYSLTEYSLEELGLVEITRRDGREKREIDGHEQSVWRSKQFRLTDKAHQVLAQQEAGKSERYEDLSKRELIERVDELETRLDRLETVFKDFRTKVMKQLN